MGPVTQRTDALGCGAVDVVPQFTAVSLSASGDLIAAVTGQQIKVLAGCLVAAGTVTAQFQSGGSANLTGAMTLIEGVPLPLAPCQWGHFATALGAKLNLVLGSSVQVSGWLVWVSVPPR